MSKKIVFSSEMWTELVKGVKTLVKAVEVSYGPNASNVIIQHPQTSVPLATKDGATVATNVELEDPIQNLGVKLLKESATNILEKNGDGTTTTLILAGSLIESIHKAIVYGHFSAELVKGMRQAYQDFLREIETEKVTNLTEDEYLYQVAMMASKQDEELSQLVLNALKEVQYKGVITTAKSDKKVSEIEITNGFEISNGYVSSYFLDIKDHVELTNPYIFITDLPFNNPAVVVNVLNRVAEIGGQLLIIADDFNKQTLSVMTHNNHQGTLRCCAVHAPGLGEDRPLILNDLALYTGGKFFSTVSGISLMKAQPEMLGKAEKVLIYKDKTVIVGGAGNSASIEYRKQHLNHDLQYEQDARVKGFIEHRLSRLEGKILTIKVGGQNDIEIVERKSRLENALASCRNAYSEGVVLGAGISSKNVADRLTRTNNDTTDIGYNIVMQALRKPYEILTKDGKEMPNQNVYDPAKTIKNTLEQAISTAINFALTNVTIIENE